jgi:hypothetical protein
MLGVRLISFLSKFSFGNVPIGFAKDVDLGPGKNFQCCLLKFWKICRRVLGRQREHFAPEFIRSWFTVYRPINYRYTDIVY